MTADFWIIGTAILVALSCGVLGIWLILRKMAMVGDAISHAVLPGIVLAFLISGSRDSVTMMLGAGVVGIFTTFLIEFFHKKAKLQSDAAIGVTFTWLFAVGVILISLFADQVDLDQECVLYGEIAYVPLEPLIGMFGVINAPETFWLMLIIFLINVLVQIFFYKSLYLSTFDPSYALTLGFSGVFIHYLLMAMVSFTTVAAFESVGAILVVAFLIAPAATAYLISQALKQMFIYTALFGISACIIGYYLAYWIDGSIAGAMSSVLGLQFFVVFLLQKVWKRKLQTSIDVNNL